MSNVWSKLNALGKTAPNARPSLYGQPLIFNLNDGTGWLVGPYQTLRTIATACRNEEWAQDFLAGVHARFGFRSTDVAPADLKRQKSYGTNQTGQNAGRDYTGQRKPGAPEPVVGGQAATNRISDRYENIQTYWQTQTPQAHHIVEYNNLHSIGVSGEGQAEMDYDRLPAVLLMAEFHQRYISSILKPTHDMGMDVLKARMYSIYQNIYTGYSPALFPLWEISKVILDEAEKLS